jgi:hypothetical protein
LDGRTTRLYVARTALLATVVIDRCQSREPRNLAFGQATDVGQICEQYHRGHGTNTDHSPHQLNLFLQGRIFLQEMRNLILDCLECRLELGNVRFQVWHNAFVTCLVDKPQAIRRLLRSQLKHNRKQKLGAILIVCEATGGYERHVLDVAIDLGLPAHRAHGARVRFFARYCGLIAKTDPIDARVLAHYSVKTDKLRLYVPPPPETLGNRALRVGWQRVHNQSFFRHFKRNNVIVRLLSRDRSHGARPLSWIACGRWRPIYRSDGNELSGKGQRYLATAWVGPRHDRSHALIPGGRRGSGARS